MCNIFCRNYNEQRIYHVYLVGEDSILAQILAGFALSKCREYRLQTCGKKEIKVYICVTLDLAFSLKCGCFSVHKDIIIFKIHIYKAICQGTGNKYD